MKNSLSEWNYLSKIQENMSQVEKSEQICFGEVHICKSELYEMNLEIEFADRSKSWLPGPGV